MADANLYDDTSLSAEEKADAKEDSGKLIDRIFDGKWGRQLCWLIYGVIFCILYFALGDSGMKADSHIGYIISMALLSFLVATTFVSLLFTLFGDQSKKQDNQDSDKKRGGLLNLLTIWVGFIVIFSVFYYYLPDFTGSFFILENILFVGFSVLAGIILLTTLKDLKKEIHKLFQ